MKRQWDKQQSGEEAREEDGGSYPDPAEQREKVFGGNCDGWEKKKRKGRGGDRENGPVNDRKLTWHWYSL